MCCTVFNNMLVYRTTYMFAIIFTVPGIWPILSSFGIITMSAAHCTACPFVLSSRAVNLTSTVFGSIIASRTIIMVMRIRAHSLRLTNHVAEVGDISNCTEIDITKTDMVSSHDHAPDFLMPLFLLFLFEESHITLRLE